MCDRINVMKLLLFYLLAVVSGTVTSQTSATKVLFLKSTQRFNNRYFTDFFFSCTTRGSFIQWQFNNNSQRRFTAADTGQVRHYARPDYKSTEVLFSTSPTGVQSEWTFLSIFVVSYTGSYPINMEVTCMGTERNASILAGNLTSVAESEEHNSVHLELITSKSLKSNQTIFFFVCGASFVQFSILSTERNGPNIGFQPFDKAGYTRSFSLGTIYTQGILLAHDPLATVALFLVDTPYEHVTVKCFYGLDQVIISSDLSITPNGTPDNLNSVPTTVQTIPITPLKQPNSITSAMMSQTTEVECNTPKLHSLDIGLLFISLFVVCIH